MVKLCESCLASGRKVPATTRSRNPDYAGYELCEDCAREYDSRVQVRLSLSLECKRYLSEAMRVGAHEPGRLWITPDDAKMFPELEPFIGKEAVFHLGEVMVVGVEK
ncbi:MAG: hypothetical protein JRI66_11235 [Deltaproteobacteria bacterium]|nr:hypothetical protein [Deltaproteobacteria bacterium]